MLLSLGLLAIVSTTLAQDRSRIDCFPEPNANQGQCEARGCSWVPQIDLDPEGTPYCFMKADQIGYSVAASSGDTYTLLKNAGPSNPWGTDIPRIRFKAGTVGNSVINIRIDTEEARYDPAPILNLPRETVATDERLAVNINTTADPFYFNIARTSNGRKLFDTSIGGLIFSDKFIQIATRLPSNHLTGFGEHVHQQIQHDFSKYTTWGMFARDQPPDATGHNTQNLYGVQPFYMVIEPDGKSHGVLILNTNAQEIHTLPEPALVYRTIGGVLDIYIFPGPTPAEVTRQYVSFIGKPFLPAYWALGFQLCRYGYSTLAELKQRVQAVRDYAIPIDVAYADIDYMQRYKDFTTGSNDFSGTGDYVRELHSYGMRNVLIFEPGIEADYASFQRALDADAKFIEWERPDQVMSNIQNLYPMAKNTKIMLGVVWPDNHVGFVDFLDPQNNTRDWWVAEAKTFHDNIPFDGVWLDMNEPSVFGTNEDHPNYFDWDDHPNILPLKCPIDPSNPDSEFDKPPYETANVWHFGYGTLSTVTLCMSAVTMRGTQRFYNTKNLFGWAEGKATQAAVHGSTGERGYVVGRSTFPSSGRYQGKWLGDSTSRWEDLRTSVITAQEFNLFGIPYVGSDVCGFIGTTEEELCLRWHQMGAFHSFYRNHNTKDAPVQDPAVWPSVAQATRNANNFRYAYLPYLFSLHFRASLYGETVIRPMWYEFPGDTETFSVSEQYMWGPSFLVAPVLYKGATSVDVYFPTNEFFSVYDYQYGQRSDIGNSNVQATLSMRSPVFVRAGSVIPRQNADVTTVATRQSNFQLLIVPSDDISKLATGELFWDDGVSTYETLDTHDYFYVQFNYTAFSTDVRLDFAAERVASSVTLPPLESLEIFNYPDAPSYSSFTLNGQKLNINTQASRYNAFTKILTVQFATPVPINASTFQTISWKQ